MSAAAVSAHFEAARIAIRTAAVEVDAGFHTLADLLAGGDFVLLIDPKFLGLVVEVAHHGERIASLLGGLPNIALRYVLRTQPREEIRAWQGLAHDEVHEGIERTVLVYSAFRDLADWAVARAEQVRSLEVAKN